MKAAETDRNTLQQQLFRTEAEHKALLEKLDQREELSKAMEDEPQKLSDQLNQIEVKVKRLRMIVGILRINWQRLMRCGLVNRKNEANWKLNSRP